MRFPGSRFCGDCGERITDEIRSPFGGSRCRGCRAIAGRRPVLVRILALTAALAVGFELRGFVKERVADRHAASIPRIVEKPAPPMPPPIPPHPCGARTKRGTKCKRLVHGEGYCWQHAADKRR